MYPRHALVDLSDKLHEKVIESIGTLTLSVVDGVTNIDSRNNAADNLSAVLLHELIKISTAAYGKHVVDVHIQQLPTFCHASKNTVSTRTFHALDSHEKQQIARTDV